MKFQCHGCLDISTDPAAMGWIPDYHDPEHPKSEEWLCFRCKQLLEKDPDAMCPLFVYDDSVVRWAEENGNSMWDHPQVSVQHTEQL